MPNSHTFDAEISDVLIAVYSYPRYAQYATGKVLAVYLLSRNGWVNREKNPKCSVPTGLPLGYGKRLSGFSILIQF